MNIVLIGMAGSGKSTIGQKVAKKLNRLFIDMDKLIEKQENASISEIVTHKGWEFFRQKEHELAQQLVRRDNIVIATGGGVVLVKNNVVLLKKTGVLVLLDVPINEIIKRVQKVNTRPLFSGRKNVTQSVSEIYTQREKLYREAADETIKTDNKSINQIVLEIITTIKKYEN